MITPLEDIATGQWTITDQAEWLLPQSWTDRGGQPYNFTGSTFLVHFKANVADAAPVLTLSSGNGGVIPTDLANGTYTLKIGKGAIPAGTYVGDVIQYSGSTPTQIIRIYLVVVKGATIT